MKTWYLPVILTLVGTVLGCKTDPNIPILERELRKQEDEIYKLQDCVEQSKQALETCRRENTALRQKAGLAPAGSPASGSPPQANSTSTASPGPAVQPPQIEIPGEGASQMPGSMERSNAAPPSARETAPTFKPPETSAPPDTAPPYVPRPGPSSGPDATPLPGPDSAPRLNMHQESRPSTAPKVDSAFVEQIALNPIMTGPYDADGMPSDQGLSVLLETRNVRGQSVRAAAPISVVVLDPALHGDAARLARWDFSAAEVAGLYRAMSGAEGIYLQMRWPAGPPPHSRLQLYVRLSAADGRKLETHQPIAIDLPGRTDRQWAARTADAGSAALPPAAINSDGWQQRPPSSSTSPEPLSAEPVTTPAPPAVERQPELRAAGAPRADSKPAASKVERPVWSPYR